MIDFGDVDSRLLSDELIGSVLMCIDASHHMKKLTDCYHITGRCLEPLRNSTVLEQLDLSLVGRHESPDIQRPVVLSDIVIPVLESIIGTEGNSVKHLQLPTKWRWGGDLHSNECPRLLDFLEMLPQLLNSREQSCSLCRRQPLETEQLIGTNNLGDCHRIQHKTCYVCVEHVCNTCNQGDEVLNYCRHRMRMSCQQCCSSNDTVCGDATIECAMDVVLRYRYSNANM